MHFSSLWVLSRVSRFLQFEKKIRLDFYFFLLFSLPYTMFPELLEYMVQCLQVLLCPILCFPSEILIKHMLNHMILSYNFWILVWYFCSFICWFFILCIFLLQWRDFYWLILKFIYFLVSVKSAEPMKTILL